MNLRALFFGLLLTSICVSSCLADDWPDWMGAKRDGVWREKGIVKKFPENGLKTLWRKPVGIGYTGPSVSEGKVYLMDFVAAPRGTDSEKKSAAGKTPSAQESEQEKGGGKSEGKKQDKKKSAAPQLRGIKGTERIFCLSEKTGELVWEHKYESTLAISYPNGPRCTPIVNGDKVYTLGAMGKLICFQKADGKIVWQKDLMEEYKTKPPIWGYASHPLIDGDVMYCTVGGDGSALVCFDKNTGKEIWRSLTTFDIGYVPLVIHTTMDTRQLIMWNGDGLVSVNPKDGKKNWDINLRESNPQAQAINIAMPRFIGSQMLITDYYLGSMMIDLGSNGDKHDVVWRTTKKDLRAGEIMNSLMMTPYIKDGHAYGVGVNGRGGGHLMCVNLKDGKKVWSETTSLGKGRLTFASLFIVEHGDRCFLCNDQGELIIAKLTPDGYEEISRAKMLDPTHNARGRTVVWSHPAFANGRIYARNDKEIVCIDLREEAYKK